MSLSYTVKVREGKVINTKVITTVSQLDQCLRELLVSISEDLHNMKGKCVVALDIEKECTPYPGTSGCGNYQVAEKVALLRLCYDSSCLIIQLKLLEAAPCSLSSFLQLNWISFVGVGIKHCLEALDMNYGIKCRNAVDLGQIAAKTWERARYEWWSILDFNKLLISNSPVDSDTRKVMMRSCNDVALSNWGATMLTQQQIEAATFTGFLCFYFAQNLLAGKTDIV